MEAAADRIKAYRQFVVSRREDAKKLMKKNMHDSYYRGVYMGMLWPMCDPLCFPKEAPNPPGYIQYLESEIARYTLKKDDPDVGYFYNGVSAGISCLLFGAKKHLI